jgi:hypothetical protein
LSGLLSKNRLTRSTLTDRLERSHWRERPSVAPPPPVSAAAPTPPEETAEAAVSAKSSEITSEEMLGIINGLKERGLLMDEKDYLSLEILSSSKLNNIHEETGRVTDARQLKIGGEGIGYEVYRDRNGGVIVRKLTPSNNDRILLYGIYMFIQDANVSNVRSTAGFTYYKDDACFEFNGNYFRLDPDTGALSPIPSEEMERHSRFETLQSEISRKKKADEGWFNLVKATKARPAQQDTSGVV